MSDPELIEIRRIHHPDVDGDIDEGYRLVFDYGNGKKALIFVPVTHELEDTPEMRDQIIELAKKNLP